MYIVQHKAGTISLPYNEWGGGVEGGYSLQFYEMSFVVLSRKLSRKYFYFIFEKLSRNQVCRSQKL